MGPDYPHLANAPIVEAIIDVEFSNLEQISWDSMGHLAEVLSSGYPDRTARTMQSLTALLPASEMETGRFPGAPNSLLLRSEDLKRAIQLRHDGVSFHQFQPYEDWGNFSHVAIRDWTTCQAVLGLHNLNTLTVSFLNRFHVRADTSLGTWLQIYPALPEELETGHLQTLMSTSLTLPEGRGHLTLFVEPIDERAHVVTLECRAESSEPSIPASADLRSHLEGLRRIKNQLFFAAVTPAQRRLWE